jgi:hypothetical protein
VLERTGLLLAAENHRDAALGGELDHHVRAFVGDPDIVVAVDLDHVRERPGIEIVADLAQKLAVGVKLQELGRGGGIGRSARLNTKTWLFEFTANPLTSPKYMLSGS